MADSRRPSSDASRASRSGGFATLPILLVLVAGVIALAPALVAGRIPARTDLYARYGPWTTRLSDHDLDAVGGDSFFVYLPDRLVAVEEWRRGKLPLWNPYVAGGMPVLGMQTANPLDPFLALFLVLPLGLALGIGDALGMAMAGWGMISYLRWRGVRDPPALALGGVVFALNPYFVSWLECRVFLAGLSALPFALWGMERLITAGRDRRAGGALALAVGYAALAGTLQTFALFLAVLLVRGAWVRLGPREPGLGETESPSSTRSVRAPLLYLAIGLAIGVLPLVAGIELLTHSVRLGSGRTYYADSNFLDWRALALWFHPRLFGTPSDPVFPAASVFRRTLAGGSGWGAMGVVALGLAFLALGRRSEARRECRFWAGLAGGTLAVLLSMRTPLGGLVRAAWPGVDQNDLLRVLIVVNLAGAILAARGCEAAGAMWREGSPRRRWLLPLLAFLAVGTALIAAARTGLSVPHPLALDLLAPWIPGLGIVGVGWIASSGRRPRWASWLVPALAAAELLVAHYRFNVFSPPGSDYPPHPSIAAVRARLGPPDYPRFFVEGSLRVLPPNVSSVYRLADVRGYTNLPIARYRRLLEKAEGKTILNQVRIERVESPIYRLLGARYFFSVDPERGGRYRPVEIPGLRRGFYEEPRALPRAFLVHEIETRESADGVLGALARPEFDPGRSAILEAGEGPIPPVAPPLGAEEVRILDYASTRVRIAVRASAPGFLVLADPFYPGWRATLDGRRLPILPADHGLRGVAVGPGAHEVVFVYRPWWLFPGVLVAGLGAGTAGLSLFGVSGRRSRAGEGPRKRPRGNPGASSNRRTGRT